MKLFYTLAVLLNICSITYAAQKKQTTTSKNIWKFIIESKKSSHLEEVQGVLHDVEHISESMIFPMALPCTMSSQDKELDKMRYVDPKAAENALEYALLIQKIDASLKTKEIINKDPKN